MSCEKYHCSAMSRDCSRVTKLKERREHDDVDWECCDRDEHQENLCESKLNILLSFIVAITAVIDASISTIAYNIFCHRIIYETDLLTTTERFVRELENFSSQIKKRDWDKKKLC